ncbi:hypothetical protein [Enterobacter bugandensis]|uniref:hypothetical protein n=1 Tax=Enterobacter bugandensis TaxID=881260 RepID=UPI0023622545|nr:hypothetical protein [Enterobacter bugandensis]
MVKTIAPESVTGNLVASVMPLCGMEAPADAEYFSSAEWRRSPAQPVTLLTGSTRPPPALQD